MAQLISPGVQVSIIDESLGAATGPGTVPLLFIATKSNKLLPSGSGITQGTLQSNAGKIYNITSQRELLNTFGNPFFREIDGTVQQGDELNEYGLLAAHSYLGLANRCLIVRADIDTNQLVPNQDAPRGRPTNGTFWFDYSNSSFGVFRANGNVTPGLAWDRVNVKVPTVSQISGGIPLSSYGANGDIAVVVHNTNNAIFEKISGTWYRIGSSAWKSARDTVGVGSVVNPVASVSTVDLVINGITVAIANGDTLTAVISAINGASIPNIVASNNANRLQLTNTAGLDITVSSAGTGLTDYGLLSLYQGYDLIYSPHTSVPVGTKVGDIWIKTTNPNFGMNYIVKRYNSSLDQFQSVASPAYADDIKAEVAQGYQVGRVYVQFNTLGTSLLPEATHVIKRLNLSSEISVASTAYATPTSGNSFSIRTKHTTTGLEATVNVTVPVSATPTVMANTISTALSSAGITHIVPNVVSGQLEIVSENGFAFDLQEVSGNPLATMTLPTGINSNWSVLVYEASIDEPSTNPLEGTLWFNPELNVDIMVNDGNEWLGYRNAYPNTNPEGVFVTSAEPLVQSDGSPLEDYDLWIDSSDVVNYPKIHRYLNGQWELIDKTDQTTPFGIVFGDLRQNSGPSGPALAWLKNRSTPLTGSAAPLSELSQDMLHSNWVDPVAPELNPQTYPSGMLCFNTRQSTNNVKVWRPQFFSTVNSYTVGVFLDNNFETSYPGAQAAAYSYINQNPERWVTFSGNDLDGVAYMGRWSQRACIVNALREQIVSNDDIRAEEVFFNIMAAPGFVECYQTMVALNVDRKETSFIVVDPPASLRANATDIDRWAKNVENRPDNDRLGRTTKYNYSAMYYPWALSTNVDGKNVMVPSSHVAIRTLGYNDQVAYPWFPPAGTTRGVISNASSVGFLDLVEREYRPVTLNQGIRDVLYENDLNPLYNVPGRGLLVYGDKTNGTNDESSLSRVNVARLVVYLNYVLPQIVQPFLFELNNEQTRAAAKNVVDQFLARLLALNALSDFAVVCDSSNNPNEVVNRNELVIDIAIVPQKSINFIYIPVRLRNEI